MKVVTYSLDRYNQTRTEIEASISARTCAFIRVPTDEFPRILDAIDLDQNPPQGLLSRMRALWRVPQLARGLVGDFFMIYTLAKRSGMTARAESLDGHDGVLFVPAG